MHRKQEGSRSSERMRSRCSEKHQRLYRLLISSGDFRCVSVSLNSISLSLSVLWEYWEYIIDFSACLSQIYFLRRSLVAVLQLYSLEGASISRSHSPLDALKFYALNVSILQHFILQQSVSEWALHNKI